MTMMIYPFKVLRKRRYAIHMANAFLENLCIYLLPLVLSLYLTEPFTLTKFNWLIFFTLLLEAIKITCNIFWNTKAGPFIENTKKDLQLAYFDRICKMDVAQLNHIHTGYLKKQLDIVGDATANVLDELMMTANGFIIAVTIFMIQVWLQSPIIFAICAVFIVLIVIYNLLISRANLRVQQNYNDQNAQFNATAVDFLQNVKLVKNTDAKDYAHTTMDTKYATVKKPLRKTFLFTSLRIDGINIMMYIMYAIILVSLFWQMAHGTNVFNYLVFYSAIFANLRGELKGVARLFLQINKLRSANKQIESMVITGNQPVLIDNNWQTITIKDLSFNYDAEPNSLVYIPEFVLHRTDKVSIIGESGQGKTTFLALFCRFYPIDAQNYLVDYCPSTAVPNIAYISQETELFDLSIRANLCLGKNITDAALQAYLEAAGLSEWVATLADGLDTIVGEKGVKLSAGQKQRLNLIRGIILDKDIYVLDEPTANLDTISETKICHMINTYLKDKTCLIVTHRPMLTEFCNQHYRFANKTLRPIK